MTKAYQLMWILTIINKCHNIFVNLFKIYYNKKWVLLIILKK